MSLLILVCLGDQDNEIGVSNCSQLPLSGSFRISCNQNNVYDYKNNEKPIQPSAWSKRLPAADGVHFSLTNVLR